MKTKREERRRRSNNSKNGTKIRKQKGKNQKERKQFNILCFNFQQWHFVRGVCMYSIMCVKLLCHH